MVFNYSKLRGKIREVCKTQEEFAKAMESTSPTISGKLNNNVGFTQDEIFRAIDVLKLSADDIPAYFFTAEVQKNINLPHIERRERNGQAKND